jgi:hypothetical protein
MIRWLTATTLLACLVLAASYALWHYHPHQLSQHTTPTLPITNLLSPPPDNIPDHVLAELLQRTGLLQSIPADPQQHAAYLHQLLQALQTTPWVKAVRYQSQPSPHLEVQWTRIVPITFHSPDKKVQSRWWVNENTVALAETTSVPPKSVLPIYVYNTELPAFHAGKPIRAPWTRACLVALFLDPYRTQLGLEAILIGHDPVTLDLRLQTNGGSIVLWEELDSPNTHTPADEIKLRRLLEYVHHWKSLELPAGPYLFDNRFSDSLLRQPLPQSRNQ